MIVFFYGTDAYRLNKAVKKIQLSGSFLTVDASDYNAPANLQNALKNKSLFDAKRSVILKNAFADKKISELLAGTIKGAHLGKDGEITFVAVGQGGEKDLIKHKELFNLLKKESGKTEVFESLSGALLLKWIKDELAERKCQISPVAMNLLIETAGSDSYQLSQEIEKLSNYKREGLIGEEDIKLLVKGSVELNTFNLIDAFAEKNKIRAFELLYTALRLGNDPFSIFGALTYQFRNILIVSGLTSSSASTIASKAGLHPFVAKKSISQAKSFTKERLMEIYSGLHLIDINSKSGKIDMPLALNQFLLSL